MVTKPEAAGFAEIVLTPQGLAHLIYSSARSQNIEIVAVRASTSAVRGVVEDGCVALSYGVPGSM